MKKILAMLMCLMLVLPAAAQAKTFSYTIPQLMQRQLSGGGASLRVKVSAEAEGDAVAGVDAQLWETLKSLLPHMKLSGSYYKSKTGSTAGDQQVQASLAGDGETLSALTLTGSGSAWYLESDLLPGKIYSLTRDLTQAYMNLSSPQEGQWPDALRLLLAADAADDAVKAQLDSAMSGHMASLSRWLQDYTEIELTPGLNGVAMKQDIRVPAADMQQQMKDFLRQLYADEALLTLLRTVVPEADAHVYLESGMLPVLEQAIDRMQLEGDVQITRSYDEAGLLEDEKVTLPFGGGTALKTLSVSHGRNTGLHIEWKSGAVFSVSFEGGMENGRGEYSGEIFVQRAGAEKPFEALLTLSLTAGLETYNEENKSHEREQLHGAALLIRSKDGSFADQQVTASLKLTAGASSTKAAYADMKILWEDTATGGKATLNLNVNTDAALRHSEVDTASAVQTDTLSRADREELLKDLSVLLKEQTDTLLQKLLPAASFHN